MYTVSQMPGNGINALPRLASVIIDLYLNNLVIQHKADHFCEGRNMSGITYQNIGADPSPNYSSETI